MPITSIIKMAIIRFLISLNIESQSVSLINFFRMSLGTQAPVMSPGELLIAMNHGEPLIAMNHGELEIRYKSY
jgi:hypothetical protein